MPVLKKLELKETDFNQYDYYHIVIRYKKITNDVSYNFQVNGIANETYTVVKSYGWYNYNTTEYRFAPKNKVSSYNYSIMLSGKGAGKGVKIIESFVSKLSGFKKGKSSSGNMYFDKNTKIIFSGYDSYLGIDIQVADGNEVVDNDSKIVLGTSAMPDFGTVAVDTVVVK